MNYFWRLMPALLLLLVATVGIFLIKRQTDALFMSFKIRSTRTELQRLSSAIKGYFLQHDELPACDPDTHSCPAVTKLMQEYLSSKKKDPTKDVWGTYYGYLPLTKTSGYELHSAGPDKKWWTDDDIVVRQEI